MSKRQNKYFDYIHQFIYAILFDLINIPCFNPARLELPSFASWDTQKDTLSLLFPGDTLFGVAHREYSLMVGVMPKVFCQDNKN